MATRQDVQAIKERIDMVALISRYVSLTKSGASFKGRCPFHKDDTPSFVVSAEKGLWHCFGCGEGGDVVGFLMKIERLSFVEAAARLAAEAGVAFATKEDGEGEGTWKRYGLGYALPGWDGVKRAFGAKHGIDRLIQLGLLVDGEKGTYDRFRDRTIFPIYDLSNRPIGFGGRAFEGEPKYLNSPATPLFDKGRQLYGLSWARDRIKEEKRAILVEGYTDVLTLHEAGITHAVGSMGTALTSGQADLLGRFVEEVVIAYDRDAAGGAASVRGMQVLRNSGLSVRVARLEEGEDPDSLVRRHGTEAMLQAVEEAVPFHRFYLETLAALHDPKTVTGKERILAEARDFYRDVRSLPLRQEIARGIADLLDLPADGVGRELAGGARSVRLDVPVEVKEDRWGEEEILVSLLLRGDIDWKRISPDVTADDFSPIYRPIIEAVENLGGLPKLSDWLEDLDGATARRARELQLSENAFEGDTERAVQDAVDRLVRMPRLERQLAEVDTQIRACAEAGDWGRWEELTRQQRDLKLEKRSLVSEKRAQKGTHGREREQG
jgi:DNA primase